MVENVRMLDRYNARKPSIGTLYLTATHLIFVDPDGKKETWILHMHIASVEKLPLTTTGSPLQIMCKTFLSVTFVIPRERDCHEVFVTLQQLAQPVHIEDLYCFHYTSSSEDIPKPAGWNYFDLQSEYQRMRVPSDQWTLTLLNKDYELCDTYPRYLYVPSSASTTVLLGSSRFRSKGRLPVLSYLHRNKAAICRCSQPLSGFSARCMEDEQMLNCVLRTNPNNSFMYVVDTRPRINAMANRAAGKGYENENFYENIKFHFLGIENIHVMRSSLAKLIETCELKSPTMNSFLGGIESSAWLRHIKSILETSWFIGQAVNERGISVVVHCSDGWDRTAQVCSLASLFLDPYYRTIQGFQALIEKDWLAFGHKFSERCGHVAGDPKEVSPVFTQFIDCTWQLAQQFPGTFQFNERFLLTLHDHVQSCQFGTFIGNCEKDRIDLRLNERTFSLWGYMANHMNEYLNPLYLELATPDILVPNIAPQNIKFWRGMYCRFESGVHPREPLGDLLLATCDHSSSLEDHIRLLTKRINFLKQKLTECKDNKRNFPTVPIDGTIVSLQGMMLDNKYLYEKCREDNLAPNSLVQLKINHPSNNGLRADSTKLSSNAAGVLSVEQLAAELGSVALDWKTLRNIRECACSTPFDHFSRKYHCWKCGEVFCTRCIDKHTPLPGHLSQRAVPVCRPCYRDIRHSGSIESP
ncbi:myotubularin-related protein 8 isoform X6 [Zootermopsis nevadensis]|uniref:myotubularin-related protein 8 isoform X5 n=1 Tax=Zootermopsis nevadensis TaxID=136037 RepID=UPI000B8E5E2A|nr:myotubularin-related protein 8 isoform X5 [Zootermopsis nevadensis]XP_021924453.1 myotubularin-related protein 8 isoform X6 [Zootermopsis nevadensis]